MGWKKELAMVLGMGFLAACAHGKKTEPVQQQTLSSKLKEGKSNAFSPLLRATVRLDAHGPAGAVPCAGLLLCTKFLGQFAEKDRAWVVTPASCLIDRTITSIHFSTAGDHDTGQCYPRKVVVHEKYAAEAMVRQGASPIELVEADIGLVQVSCRNRVPDELDCLSVLPSVPSEPFQRYYMAGAELLPWPVLDRGSGNPASARGRIVSWKPVKSEQLAGRQKDSGQLWLGPIEPKVCLDRVGAPVFVRLGKEFYGVGLASRAHCSPVNDRSGILQVTPLPTYFEWMSKALLYLSSREQPIP